MKGFTKVIFVVVAIVFFVNTASAGPIIDGATNVAAGMTNGAIDSAKTAVDAISKLPVVGSIPGAQQMSDMANMAAGLAKGMVNTFKEMASKASQMIPTNQQAQ